MSQEQPESPAPITIAGIEIPVADQSPLVLALLSVIQKLAAENQDLRDEIQRLKLSLSPRLGEFQFLMKVLCPSAFLSLSLFSEHYRGVSPCNDGVLTRWRYGTPFAPLDRA